MAEQNEMTNGKVKLTDGTWCIVIERGQYFTKVITPFHDIIDVMNTDISEIG